MSIGIVGLGYVGLPLAVAFAETGHDVVGLDLDQRKVAAIRNGDSYIEDIPSDRLRGVDGLIRATTRYADLAGTEAIVIAVPTPLTRNREPDLGPLLDSSRAVASVLQAGQLVVLESTTYPGTTREQLVPLLEESGLGAGRDFNVAFSPERVDPGRTDYTLRTTPKVVGGLTEACGDRAVELYGRVCDTVVRVSSPEVAELTKLLENIFRSVNIALVNELAMLTDRMGIDIWEVVDAAATKPYGFMRFEPGPGMGGHCLPVDPFYLSWRAREFDMTTEFIELAGRVNQQMPYHCVARVERALNDQAKAVRGAKIALLGVSYKAGVGDVRESPALKIIALLQALGADVHYHDEFVPELRDEGLRDEPLDEALDGADLVVIVTAHPGIDHARVAAGVPSVLDLRGVTRGVEAQNVIRL
ncbi:nucleotide sugar dehydrogenase [Capillimicrobium parvum]|uniref:UDP-N-acetyl-D-glucosamine 6-dehydrogenase n=1 Tax=Capillimicrobium parvum TaxID=2884022 RepID=A0A9E6Y2F8_9ACTN|nr:nucleotide sugar dehydrogenase [Capillimicrobium parvum]UGS38785.1 UDP-N-acetyl-D-glucosamine 6-dehydrogenase [Capillimicrobium parvum]